MTSGETRMKALRSFNEKYADNALWQFIKFNLVSLSVSVIQLLLANVLPLAFDRVLVPLPSYLWNIFDPDILFDAPSKYVRNGVVTWGYVIPFFLSNFLANIYGYFVNMRATFRGKGTKLGLVFYLLVLFGLILFSTWLQGWITGRLSVTSFAPFSRTIAAMAAGLVQMMILFPLEKFVLFRKRE